MRDASCRATPITRRRRFRRDVGANDVAAETDSLEATCASQAAVSLRSDGVGKFGRASDATLWLGIAPVPELITLTERMREELAARDIPFDDKPFKPHITLARRARIPKASLHPLAFPLDDAVACVTLFKSTLERAGAIYKPLHTARLG